MTKGLYLDGKIYSFLDGQFTHGIFQEKKLNRGQRSKCAKPQTLEKQKRQYHEKRLKERQNVLK